MKQILYSSYMSMIENSIGTKMFRKNYFEFNGKNVDILKNGADSCGYFVSSILKIFGLIENIHCTVDGTIKDIEKYGWKRLKGNKFPIGSILIWEEKKGHKHIGFFIGNNIAVSNSSSKKMIIKHNFEYNGKRRIENIFFNKKLVS